MNLWTTYQRIRFMHRFFTLWTINLPPYQGERDQLVIPKETIHQFVQQRIEKEKKHHD